MAASATYKFYVDWNQDSDFDDLYDDITADVIDATWEMGFKDPPPNYANAGSLTLTLLNPVGKYNFENVESPLYHLSHPGLTVQVVMEVDSVPVVMWTGILDSIVPQVGNVLAASKAILTAYGPLSQFVKGEIDVEMQENVTTGNAVAYLLTQENIDSDAMDVDLGQTTLAKWWIKNGQSRLDALRELQDAELGRLYESKDGAIVFRDRAYVFNSDNLEPRIAYGDLSTAGLKLWRPVIDNPLPTIFNIIKAQVRTFCHAEDQPLVTLTDNVNGLGGPPIKLPVGETVTIWAALNEKYSPENYLAVYEWGMVTAWIYNNEDGTGEEYYAAGDVAITTFPYDKRMKLVFVNNSTEDLWICTLRINGVAVVEDEPVKIEAQDDDSIDKYRKQEFPYPSQWITDREDGQNMIDYIIATYKDPRCRVTFEIMANYDDLHLLEAQTIDINDRIRISDASTFGIYMDSEFIVDYIRHDVKPEREGGLHVVTVSATVAPQLELPAHGKAYDPHTKGRYGPPDQLYINGIDPGGTIVIGILAKKWNQDVYEGEIRAKYYATETPEYVDLRTLAEGGTLPNSSTDPTSGELVLTGLAANEGGVNYQFESAGDGRWYFAGRLKNRTGGWSVWSDGNTRPNKVKDYVTTEGSAGTDYGPPSESVVQAINMGNKIIPRATRPAYNGNAILFMAAQARDANQGAWRDLDADTGAAATYYDGSAVNHIYDKTAGTLTIDDSGNYGDINEGDLILFDVRNSTSFDVDYCQWGTIPTGGINTDKTVISGIPNFRPSVAADSGNDTWNTIRIKIVKPPWAWNTEGYLGDTPGRGVSGMEFWWDKQKGDLTTQVFDAKPIQIPDYLVGGNVAVRVWFENKICRAECGVSDEDVVSGDTGNPSGASSLEIITHDIDKDVPVGYMAFRFNRDTVNYESIYKMEFWLSSALPAEGPFDAERDAHASTVLETGTCSITDGSATVTATRGGSTDLTGKVICIFTDDSTPDSDLCGEVIRSCAAGSFTVGTPFNKTGSYSYAVIEPWWDTTVSTNLAYYSFSIPAELKDGKRSSVQWQTDYVPLPTATSFYVTGCSRNPYGVGTRLTADSTTEVVNAYCIELPDPGPDSGVEIETDASDAGQYHEKLFRCTVDGDRTLGNPTNAKCGQILKWCIINDSGVDITITLGDKFRNGKAFPNFDSAGGIDII